MGEASSYLYENKVKAHTPKETMMFQLLVGAQTAMLKVGSHSGFIKGSYLEFKKSFHSRFKKDSHSGLKISSSSRVKIGFHSCLMGFNSSLILRRIYIFKNRLNFLTF